MPEFASARPRRLLFLGAGLDAASWRFRIAQYLPHLQARGFEVATGELRGSSPQRLRVIGSAAHYDTICVHRALLGPLEHLWLRRAAPHYVFDFDDAIMLRDSNAAPRLRSWQRRRRFARMVRSAGAVIAGNDYLADWARSCGGRAVVLPTAVDLACYPSNAEVGREAIVGWIGTRPNLLYLRRILPVLERLCARRPDVRIKVVCDGELEATDLPLVSARWDATRELEDLHSFRVGLMPLIDDAWTRGKCGVKILQYFAAGVPVVCSPVGANREIVAHGRSGYFANDDDEWVARVDALLGDAALRQRFAAHGRAVVAERYSVAALLPRFIAALDPERVLIRERAG